MAEPIITDKYPKIAPFTTDFTPSSENKEIKLIVRLFDEGSPIIHMQEQKPNAVLAPQTSVHGTQELYKNIKLELPSTTEIGAPVEFFGKFYQVVEPKFPHLKTKWGESSLFVKPISEAEYQKFLQLQ